MTTNPSTRFQVQRYTSAIGDGWEIWDDFCDQGGTVLMFDSEVDALVGPRGYLYIGEGWSGDTGDEIDDEGTIHNDLVAVVGVITDCAAAQGAFNLGTVNAIWEVELDVA